MQMNFQINSLVLQSIVFEIGEETNTKDERYTISEPI